MRHASIGDLISGSEERLGIRQLTGLSGLSRQLDRIEISKYSPLAANSSPPDIEKTGCIMLITPENRASGQSRHQDYGLIPGRSSGCVCLVLTDSSRLPSVIVDYSRSGNIPAFATVHDEYLIESRLKGLYNEKIMRRSMVHGTLINWRGVGVLLTGESGAGKSACAIRLAADHQAALVADDATVIERTTGGIYGKPHARTRGVVEVRGKGLMDAKDLFGKEGVADCSRVDLVVRLADGINRRHDSTGTFMGVDLPVLEIPADAGDLTIDDLIGNEVIRISAER